MRQKFKTEILKRKFRIRVKLRGPIGIEDHASWVWGHRVTWGVGGVNGTDPVTGSARESLYGGDGVLAGKAVAMQLDLVKVWGFARNNPWTLGNFTSVLRY
nr:hypothetical protein [Tanacetum cinerariifolium]